MQPRRPTSRQHDSSTAKDLGGAEIELGKATKLNPANRDYALAFALTHQRHVAELVQQAGKAHLLGQNEKADALLGEVRLLDPQNETAQNVIPGVTPKLFRPGDRTMDQRRPRLSQVPVTLLPSSGKKSFHTHSKEQEVIRNVLSGYGIRPVLTSRFSNRTSVSILTM